MNETASRSVEAPGGEGAPLEATTSPENALDIEALAIAADRARQRHKALQGPPEARIRCPECGALPGQDCSGGETHPARKVSHVEPGLALPSAPESADAAQSTIRKIIEAGRRAEAISRSRQPAEAEEETEKTEAADPVGHAIFPIYRRALFGSEILRARVERKAAIEEGHSFAGKPYVALCGISGTGKSHLAAACMRRYVELRPRAALRIRMYDCIELASEERRHSLGEGFSPAVERARNLELLVLDDLGSEPNNPTSPIPALIAHRYNLGLSTWVTTWLTPEKMSERYGDGIARKVFGRAALIDCGGADWVRKYKETSP